MTFKTMTTQIRKTIKILFFGDAVGRPGRFAVRDFLSSYSPTGEGASVCDDRSITGAGEAECFIIANIENASHGFGLTEKNYNDFLSYGVDAMTCGNHIWDKKDIYSYIDNADRLIRPINYPDGTRGVGSRIFDIGICKIGVINAIGRVFMNIVDSQWEIVKNEIERIKKVTPIVVIDFHAEASAEKICFAKFCSELGVSAFFGTHTHVQTADETIIGGMAYITDAGFCGASDGVIGMDYQTSLNRFLTGIPERYEVAEGKSIQVNAVETEVDIVSGKAVSIKRIFVSNDIIKEKGDEN